MRLNEVVYSNALPVDGYGTGFFRVGGEALDAPMIILPSGPMAWGGFGDTEALVDASEQIDFVLVGTGANIAHIPNGFRETLEGAGMGVEIMASPQACRSYNVLLGEGRRVALAVLSV